MKYLLALIPSLAVATPAPKDAVAQMVQQSEFYMNCDICKVANDSTVYPPGTFAQFYVKGKGIIRVPAEQYSVIQRAGKGIEPSGYYTMSKEVQQHCTADWDGGVCYTARWLWKQEWLTGKECLMPSGKVYRAKSPNGE